MIERLDPDGLLPHVRTPSDISKRKLSPASVVHRCPGWITAIGALGSAAAGGTTYVFSTFVIRGLDRADPVVAIAARRGINVEAYDAAREWQAYAHAWTVWNHLRTVTAFVGATLMLLGLRYR